MKFLEEFKEKTGLSPLEMQYLETRVFNINEIARIYNVPLHLLQATEKTSTFGKGLIEWLEPKTEILLNNKPKQI